MFLLEDDLSPFIMKRSDIVQKYLDILDTDPEIVLPMEGTRLTRWGGTPIYYADPAGTTPVHDVGDPVGGQLDLVTGEIKATQTTDADRPVLTETGVAFDGTSQALLISASAMSTVGERLGTDNRDLSGSLLMGIDMGGSTDMGTLFGFANDGSKTFAELIINASGGVGRVRWRCRDEAGEIEDNAYNGAPINARTSIGIVKDETDLRVYADGLLLGTATGYTSTSPSASPQYDPAVGAWNLRGAVTNHAAVEMSALIYFERALSTQEAGELL